MSSTPSTEIATNRKAHRDYHIVERYEAGIELKGTEVKSIRLGHININDAFARIDRLQCFLFGCDIQPYEKASHVQHESKAIRRLLLHKSEIMKLWAATQQKGQTVVALRCYWKGRNVKIELGVGKGKTKGDQRQDIKTRVENREAQREVARFHERGKA
jgi:SsrA-binding protein